MEDPIEGMAMPWSGTGGPRFVARPAHRRWLLREAQTLLDFFQFSSVNPKGGFFALDIDGTPLPPAPGNAGVERQLHDTSRLVHCFAIAHLLGLPGASRLVDHGMEFLWSRHRDREHGGYFWGVDDARATNSTKMAYGHAFVLLAASSAMVVGHPDAKRLLDDVSEVLFSRFWDEAAGASAEEFAVDWAVLGPYRGQNSNMHLCEALMAAYEATADRIYLEKAERIASLIIDRHARASDWRVAEHFDEHWNIDRGYEGNPMFRPRGTTPGHALEWSRLLVQLWELGGRRQVWPLEAAKRLFLKTTAIGWDSHKGGFYYTLDWDDRPDRADRFWWPCAEGIGAAAVLASVDSDPQFESWYRRIWAFVANHFIDHKNGGWTPELDSDMRPIVNVFVGKPDLYHALQACLIPLFPTNGSITRGLSTSSLSL
jgi:sulfoquinovose isomerase